MHLFNIIWKLCFILFTGWRICFYSMRIQKQPPGNLDLRILEDEFKEFEPRLKFVTRLKCSWFHLKLYSMFQNLSRRSIKTGFWRRLQFIKFGLCKINLLYTFDKMYEERSRVQPSKSLFLKSWKSSFKSCALWLTL